MIALALLLLAADPPAAKAPPASIDGLPIGGLAPQSLPAEGCAAYLFTIGRTRALAAMALPGSLRLSLGGAVIDLARAGATGSVGYGLAASTEYRAGETLAVLDLTLAQRGDVTGGAVVSEATLRVERPGQDGVVVPLAGLVGCKA